MKPRDINSDDQLKLWIDGESVHRLTTIAGRKIEECVPDFSCCKPKLLVDVEVRRAFTAAPDLDRTKFLGMFLGALLQDCPVKILIVDGQPVIQQ